VNETMFLGLTQASPELEGVSEQTKTQLEILQKNLKTSHVT